MGLLSKFKLQRLTIYAWSARARRNGGELVYRDVSPRLRSIAHLSDAEGLLGIESRDAA